MSCVKGLPGVASEGATSQGVSSWPKRGKARDRGVKMIEPFHPPWELSRSFMHLPRA